MVIKNWKDFNKSFMDFEKPTQFKGRNIDFFSAFVRFLESNGNFTHPKNDDKTVISGLCLDNMTNIEAHNALLKEILEKGTYDSKYESNGEACYIWASECGKYKGELSYDAVNMNSDCFDEQRKVKAITKSREARNQSLGHIEIFHADNDDLFFQFSAALDNKDVYNDKAEFYHSEQNMSSEQSLLSWVSGCGKLEICINFDNEKGVKKPYVLGEMTITDKSFASSPKQIFKYRNQIGPDKDKIVCIPAKSLIPKYVYDKKRAFNFDKNKVSENTI